MYGIAQIALSLGFVDRSINSCLFLTIKNELKKKFRALASNSALLNSLPETIHTRNLHIINVDKTIKTGHIGKQMFMLFMQIIVHPFSTAWDLEKVSVVL